MLVDTFKVQSPNVEYREDSIRSTYTYEHTAVEQSTDGAWVVKPQKSEYEFHTDTRVPKLGCVVGYSLNRLKRTTVAGFLLT